METFCLGCKKDSSTMIRKTKQEILVIISGCAFCGKTKSRFIKNQEASALLSKLGI